MRTFVPGWSPESAASARARTAYAPTGFLAGTPRPPAISLAKFRRSKLLQGQAGTCWVHAAVRLAMQVLAAEGRFAGADLCRMMVAYMGKRLEGGGNPSDGGNVSDAVKAMIASAGGIGTCHESAWPYRDDRRSLAQAPPEAAKADAQFFLTAIADASDDEEALANIAAGRGNGIGIWWPYAFDDASKAAEGCLFDDYGAGVFGHALYEMGYVEEGVWPAPYNKSAWVQLDNWHDELYPPLPAALARSVPGYRPTSPDKTSDFWVAAPTYRSLIHGRYAERVTASGATGWEPIRAAIDLAEAIGL